MAIAHVATEYVFSDFLLKEPGQARYRTVRTELAMDKMVTCVAVGLPLLLISLAFAQEVSVGVQISCFPPANFSWRQAMYVDSYCWAALHTHTLPLWLHKFFPYILLLIAVIMYSPAVFWRFSASPLLQSDLSFIIEELDRCYNLVEQYLLTKRRSVVLLWRYLLCRGLNLLTLLLACVYLGYYLRLASVTDQFGCSLRTGLLANDTSIPNQLQCKLVAVGVFSLLSFVNLLVYAMLVPVVIYSALRPFFQSHTHFLKSYQSLPTISVLELLRRRGVCEGEDFDAMGLLQMLCLVKTDATDGKRSTAATSNASDKNPNANARRNAKANDNPAAGEASSKAPAPGPASPDPGQSQTSATEMTEFSALLPGNSAMTGGSDEGAVRHRII
ncbi:unnamed protein product [Coregonus sp. 'balchen']|nr:unnamed protein product [Coregonus sp. 'balchen']